MTADVELLPLPAIERWEVTGDYAFPTAADPEGHAVDYDAHVDAMQSYARACVEANLAPLQAENERLRAEVERLRALAGCAYQMAGVHDAPLVWLDRLSEAANGYALPDADTLMDELLPYQPNVVCEAEARAERLADALALLPDEIVMIEHNPDEGPLMFCCGRKVKLSWLHDLIPTHDEECWYARMRAMRDHDKENRND